MLEYETYHHHTTKELLDMAEHFRACVAAINGSVGAQDSRVALSRNSRTIASTGEDGVKFDFSHSAVAECFLPYILGDMEDMHTVADEARLRLKDMPKAGLHACMLNEMEKEASKCLDIQFGVIKGDLDYVFAFRSR